MKELDWVSALISARLYLFNAPLPVQMKGKRVILRHQCWTEPATPCQEGDSDNRYMLHLYSVSPLCAITTLPKY